MGEVSQLQSDMPDNERCLLAVPEATFVSETGKVLFGDLFFSERTVYFVSYAVLRPKNKQKNSNLEYGAASLIGGAQGVAAVFLGKLLEGSPEKDEAQRRAADVRAQLWGLTPQQRMLKQHYLKSLAIPRSDIKKVKVKKNGITVYSQDQQYFFYADLTISYKGHKRDINKCQAGEEFNAWQTEGANLHLPAPAEVLKHMISGDSLPYDKELLEEMAKEPSYICYFMQRFWASGASDREKVCRAVVEADGLFRKAFFQEMRSEGLSAKWCFLISVVALAVFFMMIYLGESTFGFLWWASLLVLSVLTALVCGLVGVMMLYDELRSRKYVSVLKDLDACGGNQGGS